MVPQRPTRRDALHLSGAALLALAGCASQGSPGEDEPTSGDTDTPTAEERTLAGSVLSPDSVTVRNDEGEPAVRSSAHTPSRDGTAQGEMESGPNWGHEYWFVSEPAERDALEFTVSTTGVDAATGFVADTDLSAATLLVQQYRVDGCTSVTLKRFEWSAAERGPDGSIDLRAVYDERSGDGSCETETGHGSGHGDGTDVRAIIARIPVDASRVVGFEYGW